MGLIRVMTWYSLFAYFIGMFTTTEVRWLLGDVEMCLMQRKVTYERQEMTHSATSEASLGDGLQPVSLQQQQRQVAQPVEGADTDAADVVVGQAELQQPGGKRPGHRPQLVVVGEKVAESREVVQGGPLQFHTLQLVVVQDEPAQVGELGQRR